MTAPPARDDYVAWRTVTTRWRDDDAYGHLNNAPHYELFDIAVNAHLMDATGTNVRLLPRIGLVAETSCRYFREIGFPEPIEMSHAGCVSHHVCRARARGLHRGLCCLPEPWSRGAARWVAGHCDAPGCRQDAHA